MLSRWRAREVCMSEQAEPAAASARAAPMPPQPTLRLRRSEQRAKARAELHGALAHPRVAVVLAPRQRLACVRTHSEGGTWV